MDTQRSYPYLKAAYLFIVMLLVLNGQCGKGPTQVDIEGTNDPPDTFITQKTLTKVALETDTTGAVLNVNSFVYTIEYSGTDLDGKVDSFQVMVNSGPWSTFLTRTSASGIFEFPNATAENRISVRSKDNSGAVDPTPAVAVFKLSDFKANAEPTTAIDSGPSNGATTGRGVRFVVGGADADGSVTRFVYSLDGGAGVALAPDANGKATVEFSVANGNLLPPGNHTFSVKSEDNFGASDSSPETRSFLVTTGFKPIIGQSGGPPDGGGWFTGANIPFAWLTTTSHYFGVIDRYEFSIDDPVNFIATTSSGVALDPQPAGPHTFRLKAIDIGDNVSDLLTVNFEVALFAPTEGILFIDNMSFNPSSAVYADEPDIDQQVLDGFFQNFSQVSVWDVDEFDFGSDRFPGAINDRELPGPADLAKYSSVVAMTDGGYSLDNISALLAAYFQAGGNLMITGYQSEDFGQVLKDVMGTPTVFNGFGSNLMSLEGYQSAGGNNSDAYSFLTGADVVPVIPGVTNRSWEITTNSAPTSFRVLRGNVFEGGSQGGNRIATEVQGEKGNWGLWVGVSMGYLDQKSTGIVKFGDFVLGDRFGEVKK